MVRKKWVTRELQRELVLAMDLEMDPRVCDKMRPIRYFYVKSFWSYSKKYMTMTFDLESPKLYHL